ncbi:hypothetical protein [Aurantimonas sp. 22II-16-19i]|uniref:hypothetical protein n=1 Tax=Aurantimonas sp. 22II-16-19i TaxID=1317114 RepID=UPI0009F7D347|nr:hypothetical protein [Aurantimonas sp. 22II-16-19i]ORE95187.1 hypothetical protein ATO4_12676 [Aurantimonas sp. 22II-16-19i]
MSSSLRVPGWKPWDDGILLAFAFALAVGLAGCDDAPVAPREEAEQARESPAARWHGLTDPTPIPLFLARIVTGRHDLRAGDPAVAPFADALAKASRHYIETERMIANRLIQAGDRLAERGTAIEPLQLLDDLALRSGDDRRSFGTEIHHYLNLRVEGLGHTAALARLDGALAADAADAARP